MRPHPLMQAASEMGHSFCSSQPLSHNIRRSDREVVELKWDEKVETTV